jgi:hypothetical protein
MTRQPIAASPETPRTMRLLANPKNGVLCDIPQRRPQRRPAAAPAGGPLVGLGQRDWNGVLARNLGPSSIPSLGEGVMLGAAWIDRPVDTQDLHSLLPRPP